MTGDANLYWDSCVFVRYLTEKPAEFLADIEEFISDSARGDRRIYFSTLTLVEIRQDHISDGRSVKQFFFDMQKAFIPIEPNPNVMIIAGALRDAPRVNPGNPTEDKAATRILSTPDAIHLATCVYARRVLGIDDIVFHTLDEGRGKNYEGRCVPLIGLERWYPEGQRTAEIKEVCSIKRIKPDHPAKRMYLGPRATLDQPTPHSGR